ncbi:MAG TPA: AraC family transcriptional regulator [Bryobacteraceae bacterium]|nr:AraC family transcriptional regulator [Bryobacteraceae bacterium]
MLTDLTAREGMHPTALDAVKLARADHNIPRAPVLYEPSIYIVASGRKKGFIGDRQFVYDQNNYLVLSVPLPLECVTEIGHDGPMLALAVRVDLSVVGELALKMGVRGRQEPVAADGCVQATPMNAPLSDAAVRLLECLRSPVDTAVLGPGIVREIVYHVLCGPRGDTLFAMLSRNGPAAQIHALLHRMHTNYTEPLNVTRMADEIGMSVSAFHHNFKAVTGSSPLQYLKSVRLHKARMLMMHEGLGAAVAAERVGYESASQFSREFKRFFGIRPTEEARRVREIPGAGVAERIGAESA